jgi:hypothetical protein
VNRRSASRISATRKCAARKLAAAIGATRKCATRIYATRICAAHIWRIYVSLRYTTCYARLAHAPRPRASLRNLLRAPFPLAVRQVLFRQKSSGSNPMIVGRRRVINLRRKEGQGKQQTRSHSFPPLRWCPNFADVTINAAPSGEPCPLTSSKVVRRQPLSEHRFPWPPQLISDDRSGS